MPRIAIGICTYRRPEGLSRLLDSLECLALNFPDDDVCVVIIDNSPDGSAREICNQKAANSRFLFRYVNETRKGLANARNAAIAEARAAGAIYLASVDDDEMVQKTWLQDLLSRIELTGAIIAAGPSYPMFATAPEAWVPIEAYACDPAKRDGFVDDASSANMIVNIEGLEKLGFSFDLAFNESGGEDTHLFMRLRQAGERIAWADSAIVWDTIPLDRMRRAWLFRRWYRTGTTEARLSGASSRSAVGRVKNIAKGAVRLGFGSVRIVYGALWALAGQPQRLVSSCYTFCRGAGYLASAFGYSFDEYSKRRYR